MCLAVTSHLHFRQSEQDLLHATAVIQVTSTDIPKSESAQKFDAGEDNFPATPVGTQTGSVTRQAVYFLLFFQF